VTGGSILSEYPAPSISDLDQLRSRLSLPDSFLFYPAQTWPHKNHERLLDAVALVRDRHGVVIPLVCPGRRNHFYPHLIEKARGLGLDETTWFPGFVSPLEVRGLYQMARALVFPSRFEGWGLPICEAFSAGLPVASSTATGLADLIDDAGLLFDPLETKEIADQIHRIWIDPRLRATLSEKGRQRAKRFSFDHAARLFRASYRRLAGRPVTDEDRILLQTPPAA
jgi:glycosyltransferase involved in cell wall biosynthesis